MSDEAVRKEFEAWAKMQGDLLCPCATCMTTVYPAIWQASRSAAIQECAELFVEGGPLRDAVLALKER